jgi:hypothetical protein
MMTKKDIEYNKLEIGKMQWRELDEKIEKMMDKDAKE